MNLTKMIESLQKVLSLAPEPELSPPARDWERGYTVWWYNARQETIWAADRFLQALVEEKTEPEHIGAETGRISTVECPVPDCLDGCIAFINEANGAELRSNVPCELCNGVGTVDTEIAQAYEAKRYPR